MKRVFEAGFVVLTLSTGSQLSGQDIVRPGSPTVQTTALGEFKGSFDLVLVSGQEERTTTSVTRSLSSVGWEGERAFVLAQQYRTTEGVPTDTDSSWVAADDLRPLAYRAQVGEEQQSVDFLSDGAHGTIVSPDSSRSLFHPEAVGAFNSVSEDVVIGSLPLRDGYSATIHLYSPGRGTATVDVVVEGVEQLPVLGGEQAAWRIRYMSGIESWFWFDVESRQLIRSRTALPDGSEFWRVKTEDLDAWRSTRRPVPTSGG